MVKDTLNELSQLKNSGFGQPHPRHGLNLLYWFTHDYINLTNGNIVSSTSPENTDFGFKKFHNRIEDDDDNHIVPLQNLPYYEVGNLKAPGADELPTYVRAHLGRGPDSNKDRIIVRLDNYGNIERVFITEHSDQKRFDNNKTYRVSQGLLKIIKSKTREEYLNLLKPPYINAIKMQNAQSIDTSQRSNVNVERPPEGYSWCTIL